MAANVKTANFNTSTAVTAANHSPSSPNQSHRATRAVSPPWTQIVRGELEPIAIVSSHASSSYSPSPPPSTAMIEPVMVEEEGAENGSAGPNGNAGKRTAWNKPSNEASESVEVMGADTWPALSETARVSSKPSSDSSKASSDDPSPSVVSLPKGSGNTSLSSSQKPVSTNSNTCSTPNDTNTMPARQRPMKRNGNNSTSNGGISHPLPQGPVVEAPMNSPSPRDHIHRSGFVSQPHISGNDHPHPHPHPNPHPHPHPRSSFRNRNGASHPRGDGSHHQSYGGRRNQEHGNHDWNGRNFSTRDGHMQPRVVPRLIRHPSQPPPPNTAPYIAPPPVRPFGPPMFPELPVYLLPAHAHAPETFRPFIGPMQQLFFPPPDPQDHQLQAKIVNQIEYYFSNDNLIRDTFLRKKMDDQGWVHIKVIADFNRVSLLTDNIQLILDALRSSTVVEVQDDKVRRRGDWNRWILNSSFEIPTVPGQDALVARVQNISFDQSGARSQEDSHAGLSGRSSSGGFNQSKPFNGEGASDSAHGGPASNSN